MSDLQQILNTFGDLVGKCIHVFLSTVTLHIFKHFSLISLTIAEVSDCMFCSIYVYYFNFIKPFLGIATMS